MGSASEQKVSIVVTTIASPNYIMKDIAENCKKRGYNFIIIGDEKSPADFHLDGSDYYDLKRQRECFKFAQECPTRHYTRKNVGYLLAMQKGSSLILETDDDNLPLPAFWQDRKLKHNLPVIEDKEWVNIYRYFTSANIWPRGFSLDALKKPVKPFESLKAKEVSCPIQQGLANEQPDVDAIYPLILPLPISFENNDRRIILKGPWCPFNSQNTAWWPETFPLLYLPSYSTFRLTDIWRSYVVQRIAYENNWGILFHEATVEHKRNQHNYLADFKQEVPGYLNCHLICEGLGKLNLKAGLDSIPENLHICYEQFVSMGLLDAKELALLKLWLSDVKNCLQTQQKGGAYAL